MFWDPRSLLSNVGRDDDHSDDVSHGLITRVNLWKMAILSK